MRTESTTQSFSLNCGATLLVEPMPDVQSASFSILVPSGSIYEPAGKNGTAAILSDLITRGAGEWDSRALSREFDRIGAQRSEVVGWNFLSFNGALLSDHLPRAMDLYTTVLQHPRMPAEEFPAARLGVEQTLRSMDDEPHRKVFTELRKSCYDDPWGRPSEGTLSHIPSITYEEIVGLYQSRFGPTGTIIGVAGNVDPVAIRQLLDDRLSDWAPQQDFVISRQSRGEQTIHLHHESAQTHIGLAWETIPHPHPDYYAAWAAISILGGGSSSRLFTEVRERRGLCYSVSASLSSLKQEARALVYVGTTTERAEETLEVARQEIEKLKDGVTQDELERCKARAKSSLVMQQESTGARASSIAKDWYFLGRIQTLEEIRTAVDELSVEDVNRIAEAFPTDEMIQVTVGARPVGRQA